MAKKREAQRILVFGRPGSGKTTYSVFAMLQALRRGDVVVSNIKIKWFGYLHYLTKMEARLNKLYSWFFTIKYIKNKREKRTVEIIERIKFLEHVKKHAFRKDNPIPKVDLTVVYKENWELKNEYQEIQKRENKIKNGKYKNIYFPPENYVFEENLETAVNFIVEKALDPNNKDKFYGLYFDEGFTALEHGKKPAEWVTNFFNQTRKINCDCVVSSQRAVAVYPNYRQLCTFMLQVERGFGSKFTAKQYFVDFSQEALPNLTAKMDEHGVMQDEGKKYISWKGRDVFPFFDTTQSIGLQKLLDDFNSRKNL